MTTTFDAFNVMAAVPFSVEEFGWFGGEPEIVLEERFPGIRELVEQHGEDFGALTRKWGFTYWSTEKVERILGYKPRYNFAEFFAALKEGDRAHYPYADLPWWEI